MTSRVRTLSYSLLSVATIGCLFGVVFAVRAIGMSELENDLRDMLVLIGWVALTFAVLFLPIGLVGLALTGLLAQVRRRRLRGRTRIYLLAWFVMSTAISIPFLGYYYSSGIDPATVPAATSPWDLLPYWLLKVGRWIGFSLLTGAWLAFVVATVLSRVLQLGDRDERPFWSQRLLIGIPALILLAWVVPPLWLLATRGAEIDRLHTERGVRAAEVETVPPLARVLVVGWDGATWDVVDPLLERGLMPNLARLIEEGTRAELGTFEPTLSPLIWTTISTGRPPGQHGVRSHVENRFLAMNRWFYFPPLMGFDRVFGRVWERLGLIERVQVTSYARQRQAFWNILSDADRTVGLVNWRVTWPAEEVNGFNVTRNLYSMLKQVTGPDRLEIPPMSDADFVAATPGSVAPPIRRAVMDSFLVEASRELPRYCEASGLPPELARESEVLASLLGEWLYRRDPVDLMGVYYYRPDAIEHGFWRYREPRFYFRAPPDDVARYGQAIDQVHQFVDMQLGRLLDVVSDDTIVMLLSDHGHGPVFGELSRSGGHASAPSGILVMSGPGVRRGAELRAPTVYDIFPTLMYVEGLPIEREARGRVLLEAFDEALTRDRPVRSIERYQRREPGLREQPRRSKIDRENLENLRRLGYIG